MPARYKYLPQENEIKFKIFRRDKYAFYLFTVIIGIEFQGQILTHQNSDTGENSLKMSDDNYGISTWTCLAFDVLTQQNSF